MMMGKRRSSFALVLLLAGSVLAYALYVRVHHGTSIVNDANAGNVQNAVNLLNVVVPVGSWVLAEFNSNRCALFFKQTAFGSAQYLQSTPFWTCGSPSSAACNLDNTVPGCPPSGTCAVSNPETVAMSLSGIKTEVIDGCGFVLTRTEAIEGDDVPFLKEEWAVLHHEGGRQMSAASSSVSDFARLKMGCFQSKTLDAATVSGQAADTLLIIDHAPHPANHRFMPHPQISFLPVAIEGESTTVRGFFRMDVAHTGEVRHREILYVDGTAPKDVLRGIESAMSINYGDERRHRMVLYGLFEYQAGTTQVLQHQVTLPRCCPDPTPPCQWGTSCAEK